MCKFGSYEQMLASNNNKNVSKYLYIRVYTERTTFVKDNPDVHQWH